MEQPTSHSGQQATARPTEVESPAALPGQWTWSRWDLLESLTVFVIGVVLMNFIYAGRGGVLKDERGVPGHDSFYHIKMAAMIPEHGLPDEFPWLRFVYFTDEGHDFVCHHYGFHVLLAPFVQASRWFTGDCLAGGRWAIATTFASTLVLFNLLLIGERIRWRWLWLMFFLLMPFQFFTRHAYVRAISPSLMFMLLIVLLMFRRRFLLTGLTVACYTHLYLGGVLYAPLLVGVYVLSSALGPRDVRAVPWRLIGYSIAGWVVGVLTHPYSSGMLEFLKLQVFGSGLSPDISVGREWKPYKDLWWFAQMSGTILCVWAIALCARLRFGSVLGVRAQRGNDFRACAPRGLEHSRKSCSGTPLSSPLPKGKIRGSLIPPWQGGKEGGRYAKTENAIKPVSQSLSTTVHGHIDARTMTLLLVNFVFLALTFKARRFIEYWPLFCLLSAAFLAAPVTNALATWFDRAFGSKGSTRPAWTVVAAGLVTLSGLLALAYHVGAMTEVAPFVAEWPTWTALTILYMLVPLSDVRLPRRRSGPGLPSRWVGAVRVIAVGVAFLAAAVCFAAYPWSEIQRKARCGYDLPAVREAMAFLKEHSEPGDVVFTDDWDIFPVYFYYNSHNHYIVGLDPKFTQARRPKLWERYVKVSRGQVPADISVEVTDESGQPVKRQIHVQLEDIRDHFGAKFVVTDRDHKSLAGKLARAKDFAELIYPSASYNASRDAPYLIFQVHPGAQEEGNPKRHD